MNVRRDPDVISAFAREAVASAAIEAARHLGPTQVLQASSIYRAAQKATDAAIKAANIRNGVGE